MQKINPTMPLKEDDYVRYYDIRRQASSMTSNSASWLCSRARELLLRAAPISDCTFKVLSVGPGPGDIDIQLIRTLQSIISQSSVNGTWTKIQYIALEPNPTYYERLRFSLNQLDPQCFSFEVQPMCFEQFDDLHHKFDVVLFAHVLYYFDHLALALQRARYFCRESGSVFIFHLGRTSISDIIGRIIKKTPNDNEAEVITAREVEDALQLMAVPYSYEELEAELDVTECLQLSELGRNIMSFCIERDLSALNATQLSKIATAFCEKANKNEDGRFLLSDPVGIFVIDPPKTFLKSNQDTDKVDDYRVLNHEIPWRQVLRSVTSNVEVELRVLDLACGRGRWINAFSIYAAEGIEDMIIELDVLDVSHSAVEQLRKAVKPPFKLRSSFISKMQDVVLDKSSYDVIWSMHGFYAVPVDELPSVLLNMQNAIRKNGICIIALATRKSFYLTMPKKYAEALNATEYTREKETNITSAENVITALRNLNISFKVRSLVYEQRIEADAKDDCISYVVRESMFNSFNADESGELEHFANTKSLPQRQSDENIMNMPAVQHHIKHCLRGSAYNFLQDVQLITFGNNFALDDLPNQMGIYKPENDSSTRSNRG